MRLGIIVIGLLLTAWAVLLLPSLSLSRRAQASPINGIRRFENTMGILANTRATQVPGRWVMVPRDLNNGPLRRRTRVIRRRRQTFQRLLFLTGAAFLLGLLPHMRVLLLVHLLLDASVAMYVVQLRRWARDERKAARRASTPVPQEATIHTITIPDIDDEHDTIALADDFAVSR